MREVLIGARESQVRPPEGSSMRVLAKGWYLWRRGLPYAVAFGAFALLLYVVPGLFTGKLDWVEVAVQTAVWVLLMPLLVHLIVPLDLVAGARRILELEAEVDRLGERLVPGWDARLPVRVSRLLRAGKTAEALRLYHDEGG